jgi:hypothetical protein
MLDKKINSFPPEVPEQLQYYAYRLIDPRNDETFYVGKGKENRVFSHASGEIKSGSLSEKLTRIRKICLSGVDVAHVLY